MKKERLTRRFLGKTEGFENKQERNFEKTHLRAYLNGNTRFRFGFYTFEPTGQRLPKYYDVKQEYFNI